MPVKINVPQKHKILGSMGKLLTPTVFGFFHSFNNYMDITLHVGEKRPCHMCDITSKALLL